MARKVLNNRWRAALAAVALVAVGGVGVAVAATDGSEAGPWEPAPAGEVKAQVVREVDGARYVTESGFIAPGSTQFGVARCGSGWEVMGGGAQTASTAQDVNATFPFDGGDPNAAPDDGWRVQIQNNGGTPAQAWVHAICLR
jgi:hypothetical protein